jgi:hypothetical protein
MDVKMVFRTLVEKFGMGDKPKATTRCYRTVQRVVNAFGLPAWDVVVECIEEARSKLNPGRWFRCCINDRLHEMGFNVKNPEGQAAGNARMMAVVDFVADASEFEADEKPSTAYDRMTFREKAEWLRMSHEERAAATARAEKAG